MKLSATSFQIQSSRFQGHPGRCFNLQCQAVVLPLLQCIILCNQNWQKRQIPEFSKNSATVIHTPSPKDWPDLQLGSPSAGSQHEKMGSFMFIHSRILMSSHWQTRDAYGCIWMYITCPSSQSLMHPVLPDGHNNAFAKSIAYTRLLPIPQTQGGKMGKQKGNMTNFLSQWPSFTYGLMPFWSVWKVALASLAKLQHARGSLAMCSEAEPSATKRCLHRSRPL